MAESAGRDTALDAIKGILILLIVLGHNVILIQAAPWLRLFLYNWHVYAFFLVAMVLPIRSASLADLRDRAVRYYVPFAIFLTIACILSAAASGLDAPVERGTAWLKALLIGSAYWAEQASGAQLFWFLPALLGFTLLRFGWHRARGAGVPELILCLGALAAFLTMGLLPAAAVHWTPLGLPIALYILGPSLLFVWLWPHVGPSGNRVMVLTALGLLIAAAVANGLAFSLGTSLILAQLKVYSVREPVALLVHAAIPILNCLAIVAVLRLLPRLGVLEAFGRHSLLIYLSHQLIYTPLVMVTRRLVGPPTPLAGIVIYVVVVALSLAFAVWISRTGRLRALVIPGSWAEWKSAFLPLRGDRHPPESRPGQTGATR